MRIAVQRAVLRQQTRTVARAFTSTVPTLSRPSHMKNGQESGKFNHQNKAMAIGCGLLAAGTLGGVAFLDRKHTLQAQLKETEESSRPSPNTNTPGIHNLHDLLGVSVHHLEHVFLPEVLKAGRSRNSKIHEVEPLEEGTYSVNRSKGADRVSPIDGEMGASYVHSLEGEDHVGKATFMLSYAWGNTVGDIVDTLKDYCSSRELDPKRTYVWICCLYVNQHRVLRLKNDLKKSGMAADTKVDFFDEFGRRVTGISRVLAMMAPWEEPEYLQRRWCVFEIYSANQNEDCRVDIVMPPDQQRSLEEALVGKQGKIDALYDILAKTKVQHAEASVEADRRAILEMVEKDPGYDALNHRVNEWLRAWVADSIDKAAERRARQSPDPATDLWLGSFYFNVGKLLQRSGEYERAMDMFQKSLAIKEVVRGTNHEDTAATYGTIGSVLNDQGKLEEALVEYRKALAIEESAPGKDHPDTATTYNNIGTALHDQGKYEEDLAEYTKALTIRESALGKDHPSTATTYNNIGAVLKNQGKYEEALAEYRKALAIQESALGKDHPQTAATYGNIGSVLKNQGKYEEALAEYRKALAIRESALGKDHPETATTYNNIGTVLWNQGKYEEALAEFRKALAIQESALGKDHPHTAATYNNIGLVLLNQGRYEEALAEYQKVLAIRESALGKDHPSPATTYNNMGTALAKQG